MRTMRIGLALSAGAILLAGCATSRPVKLASAGAVGPKVCTTVEVTGSRLPHTECHTAAEWATIKSEGNDDLQMEATPHSIYGKDSSH